MLGHFLARYPDESLYSICARISKRARCPSPKSLLTELYGAVTATVIFYLPNRRSNFFTGSLPRGTSLSVDCLIDHHIILPFFGAFLPPERELPDPSELRP